MESAANPANVAGMARYGITAKKVYGTLLALEPHHEVAVLELAMSAPGEIALLAQIAEPQVAVVTNVAPVHLQFFDSVDSIARAKYELIENLQMPATAVLNYDDARVRRFAEGFEGRVVTFG